MDREGAVIDVALPPAQTEAAVAAWRGHARRLLDALGWSGEELAVRPFSGGVSLALSAPVDALYSATEINEWAWRAAAAELAGSPPPDLREGTALLRDAIEREENPALQALQAAAAARRVTLLADDDQVSVGLGKGSRTWPARSLPDPDTIDWSKIHDVPVALVTGTNGKSTTVRLLAAMARSGGWTVGTTSTDRIEVGDEVLDRGDYSGPGGARTLLRDRRVEMAILETARGGILRRGLALRTADAALVTNVAEDHLGDYGVLDLDGLAETKMVAPRAVRPGGRVVLNADDPQLVGRVAGLAAAITWFSLDPANPTVRAYLVAGGTACLLDEADLLLARGERRLRIARAEEVPIAFGGAARYNLANALAAMGLADALGLPAVAMAAGLRRFRPDPESNPGRANLMELGSIRVLVDYAHNPHGLAAVLAFAASLPAARRLVVLGQAGDRDDEAIRELARTAWSFRPDHVVLKELPSLLRGRPLGEISRVLADEMRRLGAPAEAVSRAEDDMDATRQALAWARPGDLLVLLTHTLREDVLALLGKLRREGWEAGAVVASS
ncbi:MAG TPA: Mur ligase family protein [Thermoanaerobaculia bacterium]|nr:Mur ligase family protein [Thermoanaerobaculia bacterium]